MALHYTQIAGHAAQQCVEAVKVLAVHLVDSRGCPRCHLPAPCSLRLNAVEVYERYWHLAIPATAYLDEPPAAGDAGLLRPAAGNVQHAHGGDLVRPYVTNIGPAR